MTEIITSTQLTHDQRRKVVFLRPPNGAHDGTYYDYFFKPKDKVLEQYFDVTIVTGIRSLRLALRRSRYDAIIFYVNFPVDPYLYTHSVLSCLRNLPIVKIMLHNTDPFCHTREIPLILAETVKPDAVFLCDPVGEAYQKFSIPVFYWPWSVDPSDYRYTKKTHDLFVSTRNSPRPGYYVWRAANGPSLQNILRNHLVVTNDLWRDYQFKIASCRFAYTCGSCTNTIVNKHLEIPASATCLITEKTALVECLGFQDLKNCVWGAGDELIQKVRDLNSNRELLQEITDSGKRLILDNHSHKNRTQISEFIEHVISGTSPTNLIQKHPFDRINCIKLRDERKRDWLIKSPQRDLLLIERWRNIKNQSQKSQELDFLKSYLRQGHPDLSEAEDRWLVQKKEIQTLSSKVRSRLLASVYAANLMTINPITFRVVSRFMFLSGFTRFRRRIVLRILLNLRNGSYMGNVLNLRRVLLLWIVGVLTGSFKPLDSGRLFSSYLARITKSFVRNLQLRGKSN